MSTLALLALVAGIAILAAIAGAVVAWSGVRRSQAIRSFASAHGMSYMGSTWVLGDCDFALFQKGYRRAWNNVVSGTWNSTTLVYADYQFTEGSGRSRQTYIFSIAVSDLGCQMPVVDVTSRSLVGELAEELGVHGLEFESEEFNRRYVVESEDERFAFELIDARMIEVLLVLPPGTHVQFGPSRMVVWGHRLAPAALASILDAAAALDQQVPVVVRHDYGTPAAAVSGGTVS